MKKLCIYYTFLFLFFTAPAFAVQPKDLPHIDIVDAPIAIVRGVHPVMDNMKFGNVLQVQKIDAPEEVQALIEIHFKEDERIDKLVQIAYTKCISVLGDRGNDSKRYYSCLNMVLTFTAENGAWGWWVKSPTNDYGICQLHYTRHKDFIDSEAFKDPVNQIDYCIGVWKNSADRGKMPWVAYGHRNAMKNRFVLLP